jgi:hypothetical protein
MGGEAGEGAHREIAVRSIVCLYMARILSPEENRNIVESFARRMRTLGPEIGREYHRAWPPRPSS